MQKVVILIDYANIQRSASDRGLKIDYRNLLEYLANEQDGRSLVDAFCYVPIDPRNVRARDRAIEQLAIDGYLVRSKIGTVAGDSYKCNVDVEMTMELMRVAHDIKPDIVVLCSGDGDFVPVVDYLRSKGVRAEIAAFVSTASRDIILKASSFIDLDIYMQSRPHANQPPAGNATAG